MFLLNTPTYHFLMAVIALTVLAIVLDIRRQLLRKEKPLNEKNVNQFNLFAHDVGIDPDS